MKTDYWNAIRIAGDFIKKEWREERSVKISIHNIVRDENGAILCKSKMCEIISCNVCSEKYYIIQTQTEEQAILNYDEFEIQAKITTIETTHLGE